MGRTVSSHHSRGSTPHQTPPGRCRLLTTPTRGCQGSRAKDSTHLACPWASTTRSVWLHPSIHALHQDGLCTLTLLVIFTAHFGTNDMLYAWCFIIVTITTLHFCYSKSPSMVRAPTSLEVDTPTAKATGFVLLNPTQLYSTWNELYRCFHYCTFLPLTAPQARQLPPLPGPWKPHTPYDPRKWYSSLPVAKPGCEAPVSTRHETKYDGATAPSEWVSQPLWNKWFT